MKNLRNFLSIFAILAVLLSSCNTSQVGADSTDDDRGMSKTAKGGIIGAGSGAVVGGVVGRVAGNTAAGAIIGAAVGGATGAIIGRQMDKQAEELERDLENAEVERVGEGIKLTFDSGILFETNSAELQPKARTEIAELAETLKKYPDTNILIEGHTDNTGTREYNQRLSERRAQAVADYAASLGVDRSRLQTQGYSFDQPVADNTTAAGRAQNRRVEIAIFANEKMKRAAERGEL
ncbi:outer membrane protein OmpA-like peptidoglycan-associated protein [Pontibacter ummariensis]|uniref:Outer membrane protein OmpA n=1 Tax=Pontibacter ummariensis TaxID=1610492 RepID=A0A239HRK6_9BACT|nr:OmpA family protein [Pontibacter ummariensis]PRY10404.1 outer membrane protein OmpA-like peptidoglycan-associated protein [Pontibacter ummariensis]SNS83997.1 Outer membrane protein OmpA [Pontibacter ummariensis]